MELAGLRDARIQGDDAFDTVPVEFAKDYEAARNKARSAINQEVEPGSVSVSEPELMTMCSIIRPHPPGGDKSEGEIF